MSAATQHRVGQVVHFMRCGILQSARIDGFAYVISGLGGCGVSGSTLADPRYSATSTLNGMTVHVLESEIVS